MNNSLKITCTLPWAPDSSAGRGSTCNVRRSVGEGIGYPLQYSWASLVVQLVKNPPAMQETLAIPGPGGSAGEGIGYPLQYSWSSMVAQLVKNLPAMWETLVQLLGQEDLLEKG